MMLIYLTSLLIFLIIDAIWLALIANSFYSHHLGFLMIDQVNYLAALVFYLIFIFGLVILVIKPALKERSLKQLILKSCLFGLTTYATYDLTNLATIDNWPLIVTIIDLIWGMFISLTVSLLTYIIWQNRNKLE